MKGGGKFSEQQYMYFSLPKSVATNRDRETSWKLSPDFTKQQIKQFHSQMRKGYRHHPFLERRYIFSSMYCDGNNWAMCMICTLVAEKLHEASLLLKGQMMCLGLRAVLVG